MVERANAKREVAWHGSKFLMKGDYDQSSQGQKDMENEKKESWERRGRRFFS